MKRAGIGGDDCGERLDDVPIFLNECETRKVEMLLDFQ